MKNNIEQIFLKLQNLSGRKKCEFYSPLSYEKIEAFENENGIWIPCSYKQWLNYSNGGRLFGGYVCLYGIDNPTKPSIGSDFSDGRVPHNYLILGYMESAHICYDMENESFLFYEYEKPDEHFSNFAAVLEYIIDVCEN